MSVKITPEWMSNLEDEDLIFVKNFVVSSGSLKDIARQYGVTYPTVRLKLDRVIQKIKLGETTVNEPYINLIKKLAISDKLDINTAKILISEYKKINKEDT